jgi:rhodanese-related sulfurtransferase
MHPKQSLTWLWIGLGVVILAATGFLLLRNKSAIPTEISAAQAYKKYQQGAFILDVRSQEEWDQLHIANSILIPLDELQSRMNELPRDRDIVVVCLSGHRSKEGMTLLQQAGFSRASCMTGGLTAWKAAGYPLEGSAP